MAVSVSVIPDPQSFARLSAVLDQVTPKKNTRILSIGLRRLAIIFQKTARSEFLVGRGRKGGNAHPSKLTARTGNLIQSIQPTYENLPGFVNVRTDLAYAYQHEFGGTFHVPGYSYTLKRGSKTFVGSRKISRGKNKGQKRSIFGQRIADTTVTVRAHTRTYPKRPYMAPAIPVVRKRVIPVVTQVIREEIARAAARGAARSGAFR